MVLEDGMHWELLNNEIRKVTCDKEAKTVTFVTGFRTIQNEMKFVNVVWADELNLLQGEVLNYVQEITAETITMDICNRLRKEYSITFELDFEKNGRTLYKIVSNRNRSVFYVVADSMVISIND